MKQTPQEILDYCKDHGYSDPQWANGRWWAYFGHAVMPTPLPTNLEFRIVVGLPGPAIARTEAAMDQLRQIHCSEDIAADLLPTAQNMANAFAPTNQAPPSAQSLFHAFIQVGQACANLSRSIDSVRSTQSLIDAFTQIGRGCDSLIQSVESVQQTLQALAASLQRAEQPERLSEAAAEDRMVAYLVDRFDLPIAIARYRLEQFQDRHSLTAAQVWRLFQQGRININYGRLTLGHNFPHR